MLHLIINSLSRRRVQSIATVTAVAISVAILFTLYLLYLRLSLGIDEGERRLGADLLVVPASTIVEPETLLFTGQPYNVYMGKELGAQIAAIPGVRRVTPQFFAQTLNETCCSLTGATKLIGFDPKSDWLVSSWVRQIPGATLAADQVMVGSNVKGFSGQSATILKQQVRVARVLEPTGTTLDYSVLMSIDATRALAKKVPYFQVFLGNNRVEDLVSAILVDLSDGADPAVAAKAIERTGNVRVIQASSVLARLKHQMQLLFSVMVGGAVLAVAGSIFQLFGRFFSLAWERKGEWGLYRALGATRGDLKRLVAGEALLLTSAGIPPGLALGFFLNHLLIATLQKEKAFPLIEPAPAVVAAGMAGLGALFLLVGLLATVIPARQSSRIDPSSAMALADIDV